MDIGTKIVALSNSIHLTYWLVIAGSLIARFMPLRVSYAVASFIGDLTFYTWRSKRDAAIANMRQVLGPGADPEAVWATARLTYRNYLKYIVDFLRFPSLSIDHIRENVLVEGWENLNHALDAGKGVIFVGVHFGHFDLGAAVLAVTGYPVNAVVDTFQPAKLNDLIQRHRIEKGLRIIPFESAARGVLRVLRSNEILGLLVDRPVPGEGVRVNFCGAPIEVPAGAAMLALKTGAAIVPGHVLRGPGNTFSGTIYPRVEITRTGDLRRDIETVTQRMMDVLEEMIRQHPDQWYMFRHM
ncbi:MAG: lysophospholipid acyltransferase family protein, partial [Chloroflexota bacterium]